MKIQKQILMFSKQNTNKQIKVHYQEKRLLFSDLLLSNLLCNNLKKNQRLTIRSKIPSWSETEKRT